MITKRLLVVDDSEIDRGVLKNILQKNFDVIEADNGYSALKIILDGRPKIDGVLLDIFMPVLNGFEVLRLMHENGIKNLPIILITAQATKTNVEKAAKWKVAGVISKPFNPDIISERLHAMFDIEDDAKPVEIPRHVFTENDLEQTHNYISKLKSLFKEYLKNIGREDTESEYEHTIGAMEVLLNEYAASDKSVDLDSEHISIISEAAYFMDVGYMCVPSNLIGSKKEITDMALYETHTNLGAKLIWLNGAASCQYFVKVCADICMHHHERYDGRGYPHGLYGNDIPIFPHMAGAARRFCKLFAKRPEINERQFEFVLREMNVDAGEFSPQILDIIADSKFSMMSYFRSID